LPQVLADIGDIEFAYVRPAGVDFAVTCGGIPSNEPDPLQDAIKAYQTGSAAFNCIKEAEWPQHGGEDAVITKTYGAPLEVLENREQPAISRNGALEALRLAYEESSNFDANPTVRAMVSAALTYFENEGTAA
jgi:hypothetical protein